MYGPDELKELHVVALHVFGKLPDNALGLCRALGIDHRVQRLDARELCRTITAFALLNDVLAGAVGIDHNRLQLPDLFHVLGKLFNAFKDLAGLLNTVDVVQRQCAEALFAFVFGRVVVDLPG